MIRNQLFYSCVFFAFSRICMGCTSQKKEGEAQGEEKQALLQPAFTAHGGLQNLYTTTELLIIICLLI